MSDLQDGGYDDKKLLVIGGLLFVGKIDGCWLDGKYIEKKDFTPEMVSALAVHHAENFRKRIENIGE